MSGQPSVADCFCSVLGDINKLKAGYDQNDPLRFAKNKAAETAMRILSDSISNAAAVVETCKMFVQDASDKDRT